jgi:hypothetical protein
MKKRFLAVLLAGATTISLWQELLYLLMIL